MASLTPSVFKIVQSYGGMKEAYFEVESATAADTIDFSDDVETDFKMVSLQDGDGAAVSAAICNTTSTVTIGSGPSSEFLYGSVKYASY